MIRLKIEHAGEKRGMDCWDVIELNDRLPEIAVHLRRLYSRASAVDTANLIRAQYRINKTECELV